jgi:penicillin-binding protein 1A
MGLFWWYAKDAPKLDEAQLDSAASSRFYASNGDLILDFGSETREKITASEIPQQLEDAIVSVEDRRFYKHIGVDPIRIVGSALSNVTTGGMQGGSTLTQQLIKLSYLLYKCRRSDTCEERRRKLGWPFRLEQTKSKQEILTYYINKVYMSNGVYGMQTAAIKFYGQNLG